MHDLFTNDSSSVNSTRILYTPSPFAESSLLHLQEAGFLKAVKPHTSRRERLQSSLCFVVEDGEGELVYEGKTYALRAGDVVFIDCRKAYSHRTDQNLWSLRWCHFYGASMSAVFEKYRERGGKPTFHPDKCWPFSRLLSELYTLAASTDYIRDMRINEKLIKETYGATISHYVLSKRITRAKQLIRFSEMTMDEIAVAVGMNDANYFSRAFRKVEGMSPSEYQKQW